MSSNSTLSNLDLKGDGASSVEGINVRLVDLHDASKLSSSTPPKAPPPPPEVKRMNDFMKMVTPVTPPNQTSPSKPTPTKSLTEALGENPFKQREAPAHASAPKSSEAAHVKVNDNTTKSVNDLWKAIEPCWKRVADKSTLNVTLEVSFSPLGNLSKPPVIRRDPGARINDQTLRSESQAISALSQCGPYLMAYGQQNVQVSFPNPG